MGTRRRRFGEGFRIPFILRRITLADPAAARLYRRTVWTQAIVTTVLAVAVTAGLFAAALRFAGDDLQMSLEGPGLVIRTGDDGPAAPARQPTRVSRDRPATLVLAFGYVLFGVASLFEWLVIALSREYHDQIGRRAALLSRVAPEDPEAAPRVRVNLRWLGTRIKRRFRGLRVFLCGMPVLAVVAIVPVLGAGFVMAWGLYWVAVFAGAKSASAWHDEDHPPDPWFLRTWDALTTQTRLFGWWLPRAIGRFWRRRTADVFAPCARVEEAPYEMAGLALVRIVGGIPVVYLFLRPFLPVAAAHVVARAMNRENLLGSGTVARARAALDQGPREEIAPEGK